MSDTQRISIKFIVEIVGLLTIFAAIGGTWKTNELQINQNAKEIAKHCDEDADREQKLTENLHDIEIKQVQAISDLSHLRKDTEQTREDVKEIKKLIQNGH